MSDIQVLNLLLEHRGEWVSSVELSRRSLQYNSRIFSLRRDGWEIESRVEHIGMHGAKHGYYRLLTDRQIAAFAIGQGKSTPEMIEAAMKDDQQTLFGDISPTSHRDEG